MQEVVKTVLGKPGSAAGEAVGLKELLKRAGCAACKERQENPNGNAIATVTLVGSPFNMHVMYDTRYSWIYGKIEVGWPCMEFRLRVDDGTVRCLTRAASQSPEGILELKENLLRAKTVEVKGTVPPPWKQACGQGNPVITVPDPLAHIKVLERME